MYSLEGEGGGGGIGAQNGQFCQSRPALNVAQVGRSVIILSLSSSFLSLSCPNCETKEHTVTDSLYEEKGSDDIRQVYMYIYTVE